MTAHRIIDRTQSEIIAERRAKRTEILDKLRRGERMKTTHEITVSTGQRMTITDGIGPVAFIDGPAQIIVKEDANERRN
ncbi:hypothetical protein MHB77_32395 [Paenibacillus sp. FSL K6-3166]|uniref:hypothetical protein n=1 Tax=Paenibacillus sp. FSL K6-3166 TaxID=2921492 RepID=UPI000BA0D66E